MGFTDRTTVPVPGVFTMIPPGTAAKATKLHPSNKHNPPHGGGRGGADNHEPNHPQTRTNQPDHIQTNPALSDNLIGPRRRPPPPALTSRKVTPSTRK